ncbi:MAG: Gfo/Idh/MocA family oxidoreductase [Gemmatimonadetes bacterium]|nr:Gfo/Idh/MocA family oxidoreductase [Gemmatimonadota bacterium]
MSHDNHSDDSRNNLDRRDLLKVGAAGIGAAMLGASASARTASAATPAGLGQAPADLFAAPPMEQVRIGFVGVGLQGSSHCRNLLRIEGVQLKALCDIVPEKVTRVQQWTEDAGQPKPTAYTRGEWDFRRMCEEEELDLVYTATPWEWHVPVCVTAMENGKHAATEIPAAYNIEDCWRLVENAEKYHKHCVMMENVNYGRWESMVLNMVRQGMFGEILHGEGGYLHDLREIKFESQNEGLWRRNHAWTRNGNLYPTHGLGPIAQCMNINRGDRFEYLVSMSSPSRGLQEYAREHFPEGAPQRYERFALGDVNVSLIRTANGKTISVSHDTNLPRPYSRIHLVQGTKGLFQGYPNRVYIEGRSPESHEWEDAEAYWDEFQHPLWRAMEERSQGAGHGGMDFIEDYRLIQCLLEGTPTDMNVYDAAALSAVCGLSEHSVAHKSAPVDFPDFTRGRWKTTPPLAIVEA